MRTLPSGTVTFLFTDIEGSTSLLQRLGRDRYVAALTEHRKLVRETFVEHGGVEVEMQGDSFHFAFDSAHAALAAATELQLAHATHAWPDEPICVRVGVHSGEPAISDGLYAGIDVHRAARIMQAGHGGQVLVSRTTAQLVGAELPSGVALDDLGEHRLKDLEQPERLYQLVGEGLTAEFPPLRSQGGAVKKLPAAPTPLIGRERELQEATEALAGPSRVLTLTGPGGTGKTRIALQVAASAANSFAAGAVFCDLAPVTDHRLVPSTIASALEIREKPGEPLEETVAEHLRDRELLLLVDNFEQVSEAAAGIAELVARCPRLRVLATSREPLRIRGEQELPVPPLTDEEAVSLFAERAGQASSRFRVTDENRSVIAEICTRLDRLPLAIELAAARVRMLEPEALLPQLQRRLELLVSGHRDLPARQRTLRDAVAWSHDLLGERERILFRRLAVFSGGWTLEAAERVCASDDSVDALDCLASLVEKSLVRGVDGEPSSPRFAMLETIREYALERLQESPEGDELARRHCDHLIELAEDAISEVGRRDESTWLRRLEREHDNVRAALDWAVTAGDGERAVRLAGAMGIFWNVRGHVAEGRGWLDLALALDHDETSAHRPRALRAAGNLAHDAGEHERARAFFERSVALAREREDDHGVASSLWSVGWLALTEGDYPRATEALDEAVELSRRLGDEAALPGLLNLLGIAALNEPDYKRARTLFAECLERARRLRLPRPEATALTNLGLVAMYEGRLDEAERNNEAGLAVFRDLGFKEGVADCLDNLGRIALLRDDHVRADDFFTESLEVGAEAGNRREMAQALEGMAAAAAGEGNARRGASLAAVAASLRSAVGAPLPPSDLEQHERVLAGLRAQLGDEAFQAAWAEGASVAAEDVSAYATAPVSVS